MHVYISQTDRGEMLMGAEIEPWTTYRMQGREIDGFHITAGWGTYGFKAAPIAPFVLERFYEDKLVSELAAAAVSH